MAPDVFHSVFLLSPAGKNSDTCSHLWAVGAQGWRGLVIGPRSPSPANRLQSWYSSSHLLGSNLCLTPASEGAGGEKGRGRETQTRGRVKEGKGERRKERAIKKRRRKRKKQKTQVGGVADNYGHRGGQVSQPRFLPEGAGRTRSVSGGQTGRNRRR